jgi:hypothetical protein
MFPEDNSNIRIDVAVITNLLNFYSIEETILILLARKDNGSKI